MGCLGEDCERFGSSGLETSFNIWSLMTYCCYLNDNTDSNAGEGGLACEVSERRKDTFMAIPVIFFFFWTRNLWMWNLCFADTIDSGNLGLRNQLWLRRDQHYWSEIWAHFLRTAHRTCGPESTKAPSNARNWQQTFFISQIK